MKTLLETWLSEAPLVLRRELSAEVEFVPAEQLPALSGASSLAAAVAGLHSGQFAILTDRAGLHELLAAANVAGDASDTQWEFDLWQGLLQQIFRAVAEAMEETQVAVPEEAVWSPGVAAAAWQLRLGSATMLIAFADQTHPAGGDSAERQNRERDQRSLEAAPRRGIDLLLDVELEASLRFGSREMSLNEVLDLGPGDVVELDRHVSEPVDLLVGDRIVARGEVVLVNGNFGFSVLEVAEAEKRLESVRCLF
jgi:flagellar motor switch protein FliN/FliY